MGAISATDIISIIQSEIENFDFDTESRETGEVIYVGDGIATIYGIDHAMYGEIVVFDNGVKGMVQDIRQNEIGVILFGRDYGIHEGTKVVRTKKKAGIPVGKGFIGRIINALGEPIDGKGDIKEEDYRPIENEAPGIVDRKSVDTPLETGILSIDSMFPIGRGQRELIIGDRQVGISQTTVEQRVQVHRIPAYDKSHEECRRQIPEQVQHVEPVMVRVQAGNRAAHRVDAVGER